MRRARASCGKSTHTHFTRGKRVRLVLTTGEVIIGRFVERRHRSVVLDCGEYLVRYIRVMGFAHPKTRTDTPLAGA